MVENNLIILDASVIIKWLVAEIENLEDAMYIRQKWKLGLIEIIVPAHCFTETMNGIGRKYPHLANSSLSYLLNSGMETHLMTLESGSIAVKLMNRHKKISFYDAIYHSLAISKGGVFLTADEKYYNTVKKEGHIRLLKEARRLF